MWNIIKSLFRKKEDNLNSPYNELDEDPIYRETKKAKENLEQLKKINESCAKTQKEIADMVDNTTAQYLQKNRELLDEFERRQKGFNP